MSHISIHITDRIPSSGANPPVSGTFRLQQKVNGIVTFNVNVTTNPGNSVFVPGGTPTATLRVNGADYVMLWNCQRPYDADLEYDGPSPPVPGQSYPVISYTHCLHTAGEGKITFPDRYDRAAEQASLSAEVLSVAVGLAVLEQHQEASAPHSIMAEVKDLALAVKATLLHRSDGSLSDVPASGPEDRDQKTGSGRR